MSGDSGGGLPTPGEPQTGWGFRCPWSEATPGPAPARGPSGTARRRRRAEESLREPFGAANADSGALLLADRVRSCAASSRTPICGRPRCGPPGTRARSPSRATSSPRKPERNLGSHLGLVQTPEPPQDLALIALDIERGCEVYAVVLLGAKEYTWHVQRSQMQREPRPK